MKLVVYARLVVDFETLVHALLGKVYLPLLNTHILIMQDKLLVPDGIERVGLFLYDDSLLLRRPASSIVVPRLSGIRHPASGHRHLASGIRPPATFHPPRPRSRPVHFWATGHLSRSRPATQPRLHCVRSV